MLIIKIDALIIKSLAASMPTKDVRYYLNGINVCNAPDNTLALQANNGYIGGRVVLAPSSITTPIPENFSAIIPAAMVKDLAKVKGPAALTFTKTADKWSVQAVAAAYNCTMPCVDGAYPDVARVLPYSPIEGIAPCPMLVQPTLLMAFAKFVDGIMGHKSAGEASIPLQQTPMSEGYNTNTAYWYAGLVGTAKTQNNQHAALKKLGLLSASGMVMPMRLV